MRLSDRMIQVGVFSLLAVVGIGLGLYWLTRQPCPTPKRPRGVPPSAAWVGGCDGGQWVAIDAVSVGRYLVALYHSGYGDKEKEGWYELTSDCETKDLTPGQLLEQIQGYDGESLLVRGKWVGDSCRLAPVR
jgi:hypothetical protein